MAMLLFAPLVLSQQCRQVTVCNGDTLNLLKGDKGDVGSRGPKGEVGGVGEKGMQGESCDLSSLKSTLMSKLAGTVISWDQKCVLAGSKIYNIRGIYKHCLHL